MERVTKKKKETMKIGMGKNSYEQTVRAGLGINCKSDSRTAELDPRSEGPYASKIQWNFSQHHE